MPIANPSRTIVIATGNPHKIEEIGAILRDLGGIELIGLPEAARRIGVDGFPEPEEGTTSFEANATLKAKAYARATGMTCLADDSGLSVDALGGAPGVISSHYFNDGRTDGAAEGLTRAERDTLNNERLLRELGNTPPDERAARFLCIMALADPGGEADLVRGAFEGRIGTPDRVPSGDNGFGYDPLFLVAPDFERTSAELSNAEKNSMSHRAAAAIAMKRLLEQDA
ncbi:MAG: non-canonical purine NTP pyrophosphatase [Planctomycetota bacterium]